MQDVSHGQEVETLRNALGLNVGCSPFPWQVELLELFLRGEIPPALDLPTGLGKTSTLAIWLVARALGADMPRRLVYVVDRRAVVDQSTRVAEELRRWVATRDDIREGLGLAPDQRLSISTLRGQFVDNREWLDDPAGPAIVVGTVDMVGSRLLFEGYGVSRKMRPYHAGLLGIDTLFVLDESHLVPAFERLVEQVRQETRSTDHPGIPGLRCMSLSATGRARPGENILRLSDADREHEIVHRRLHAKKRIEIRGAVSRKELPLTLAEQAWALANSTAQPVRVLVFCNSRSHALKAKANLESICKKASTPIDTDLLVGARRVYERHGAAERLATRGFLAGSGSPLTKHAFLFATAAGEVGIDLDADHVVADIVAWERMVQRLGRVNRRGEKAATVIVVPTNDHDPPRDAPTADLDAVVALLAELPQDGDGHPSGSPDALLSLSRNETKRARVDAASTPTPLFPPLSCAIIESWAMTSLREHTGRPEVAPWIRGWVDQRPQTTVVWRKHVPSDKRTLEQLLSAAPPHMLETVTAETWQVAEWLVAVHKRLERAGKAALKRTVILDAGGAVEDDVHDITLMTKARLHRMLADRALVVDANVGGLSDGLLDAKVAVPVTPVADEEPESSTALHGVPWRVEVVPADDDRPIPEGWLPRADIPVFTKASPESASTHDKPSHRLRVLRSDSSAETEDDRSLTKHAQSLVEHQSWAAEEARSLAIRLSLDEDVVRLIELAARVHDEGKRATVWQRAFSAPLGEHPYAKTRGPVRPTLLGNYRHEFGSLALAEGRSDIQELSDEDRDLVLHLVASHHGWARPNISWANSEFEPPSRARARAAEVELRYARVQSKWGPWRLAFLEAVLRAADQRASRRLDRETR